MDAPDMIVAPNALVIGIMLSILTVIAAVVIGRKRGKRTTGLWKVYTNPLYIVTAVIVVLAFVLALSQGFALLEKPYSLGSIATRFFDSIHDALQTVSLDGSSRISSENLLPLGWPPAVAWSYLVYQSLLFVLAPATAFSSVVFMLFTLLASPALSWRSKSHDTYVFSELNSSSTTLAKSILAHYGTSKGGRPVIAFAEIDRADESLVDEARTLGAICSDRSIAELAARCTAASRRRFIFSSLNEAQNLRESLKLTEVLASEPESAGDSEVIVFSTSSLADGFADSASRKCSGTVAFRRFDHVQNTINQVLMEMPVFLNVLPLGSGSEKSAERLYSTDARRLLVIGSGNMGSAFLKGAIWACQSNASDTHIDVVDFAAGKARERLALECPEIERMIGKRDPDDPHAEAYDIEFHEFDVFSGSFERLVRDHGSEISYVFIALGDDLVAAQAARRVRELLERSRVEAGADAYARPPIVTVIDDSAVAASVTDAESPKEQPYDITTVGSTESLFSYRNVFQPDLDRWAKNLNAAYWGVFDQTGDTRAATCEGAGRKYDAFEYNRVSSRASALFLKHHLFEFCRDVANGMIAVPGDPFALPSVIDWTLGIDEPEFEPAREAYTRYVTSGIDREPFQELEHKRWDAFMRTLGYECCGEEALKAINATLVKKENCDHLSRRHICLVPFGELEKVDAMFERISGKNPHYKLADDIIIVHLKDIVESTLYDDVR